MSWNGGQTVLFVLKCMREVFEDMWLLCVDLFETASECVYVLGVIWKLSNKMLYSAVEEGHLKVC